MAGDRFVVHVSSAVWGGGGGIAVVKEYEIITLKYIGKTYIYAYYITVWSTREYNSLEDLTRQREV